MDFMDKKTIPPCIRHRDEVNCWQPDGDTAGKYNGAPPPQEVFIMARINVNELNNRVNELDAKMDKIIALLNNSADAPVAKTRNSGTVKGSHKSHKADSKAATTMAVNVVDGAGRGAGKKFIAVTFDGKPSDKIREELKAHGFKYFAPNKVWSIKYTAGAKAFAESLMT